MKKLTALIFAVAALLFALPATAAETASLPPFKVTLNGVEVENEYREYPLFVYKDITYFPMTYFDCRFLGIATYFHENTGLDISRENISGIYREYASEVKNPSGWIVKPVEIPYGDESKYVGECVEPAHFPARVNNLTVGGGDYPLMTLRGVTYFPLTWEYAHDMFGWEYGFDEKNGLAINSGNTAVKSLALPSYDGKIMAHDGTCVYYQGADGDVYRAPISDPSSEEKLVSVEDGDGYKPIVELKYEEGKVFAWYHLGGATSGTDRAFILGPTGEAEPTSDYWRTNGHMFGLFLSGWSEIRSDGGSFLWNKDGDIRMEYGGTTVEGSNKWHRKQGDERTNWEVSAVSAFGSKVYVAAGDENATDIILNDMTSFTVTDSIVKNVDADANICAVDGGVLFNRGGDLYLWRESAQSEFGAEKLLAEDFELIDGILANNTVTAVGNANGGKRVVVSVNLASDEKTVEFETEAPLNCFVSNGALCAAAKEEIPGENIRFAVFSEGGSFFSSDMAENVSVNNGILIYSADGKAAMAKIY